jgi:SAM-dependent methyltransferase
MTEQPGAYEYLDFNSPLSAERADRIKRVLIRGRPRTVLDVGCGWGELLLRVLAAAPEASGTGVDQNADLLVRGRRNADRRGLAGRVRFVAADATQLDTPADVAICVGADHAFGDQRAALTALLNLVRPGGRLLFGSGFWTTPARPEQAAAVGLQPDSLTDLAGLVDLAVANGFRPIDIQTAGPAEWEAFESGFLADREEWLVRHPNHPDAEEIRTRADRHRDGWLRGYRNVLGLAYLVLGVPG